MNAWNKSDVIKALDAFDVSMTEAQPNLKDHPPSADMAANMLNETKTFKKELESHPGLFVETSRALQGALNVFLRESLKYVNETVTPGLLGMFIQTNLNIFPKKNVNTFQINKIINLIRCHDSNSGFQNH